jgi:hypothetical protein
VGVALAHLQQRLGHRVAAGERHAQQADALGPVQERDPEPPSRLGLSFHVEDRGARERAPGDRALNRQRLVCARIGCRHGYERALLVVDDVHDERLHADPSRLLGDHPTEVLGSAQMRPAQRFLEHDADTRVEVRDRVVAHRLLSSTHGGGRTPLSRSAHG